MKDSLFEYNEILDWWEAERLAAHNACFKLKDALLDRAKKETENISHHHLWIEASEERKTLETSILDDTGESHLSFDSCAELDS